MDIELQRKLESCNSLPVFSDTVQGLLQLVQSEHAEMTLISAKLEQDPVIAARVLKMANSSFFGLSKNVSSLELAVVLLGMKNIKNIVYSIGVMQIFENVEESRSYPGGNYQDHSYLCGQLASKLAEQAGGGVQGEAFIGGLIHDIGKLLIMRSFPAKCKEENESLGLLCGSRLEALEFELFGLNHSQTGAWLARKWQLPDSIIDAIAKHHSSTCNQSVAAQMIDSGDKESNQDSAAQVKASKLGQLIELADSIAHILQALGCYRAGSQELATSLLQKSNPNVESKDWVAIDALFSNQQEAASNESDKGSILDLLFPNQAFAKSIVIDWEALEHASHTSAIA